MCRHSFGRSVTSSKKLYERNFFLYYTSHKLELLHAILRKSFLVITLGSTSKYFPSIWSLFLRSYIPLFHYSAIPIFLDYSSTILDHSSLPLPGGPKVRKNSIFFRFLSYRLLLTPDIYTTYTRCEK